MRTLQVFNFSIAFLTIRMINIELTILLRIKITGLIKYA